MSALLRSFGRGVRSLRALRGMTQADLAEASDLSRNTINGIEAGRQSTSIENIYALAAALDCPASDLLPRPEVIAADDEIARALAEQKAARIDAQIAALRRRKEKLGER